MTQTHAAQYCLYLLSISILVLIVGCHNEAKRRWERASYFDSVYSYQSFLEENPDSVYAEEARKRIQIVCKSRFRELISNSLSFIFKYNKNEAESENNYRMQRIQEQSYIDAFLLYIRSNCYDGKYVEDAKEMFEPLFVKYVYESDNFKIYDLYLEIFPDGKFSKEVTSKRLLKSASTSFEVAEKVNTIGSYAAFLRHNKNSEEAQKARRALESMLGQSLLIEDYFVESSDKEINNLITMMKSKDAESRVGATRRIKQLSEYRRDLRATIPFLLELLSDTRHVGPYNYDSMRGYVGATSVDIAAYQTLRNMIKSAQNLLIATILINNNFYARKNAIYALSGRCDFSQQATETLLVALEDSHGVIRQAAYQELRACKGQKVVEALQKAELLLSALRNINTNKLLPDRPEASNTRRKF